MRTQQGAPPNLGEGVTDPRAVGYAAGVQSRGLQKYKEAVAGGPPPHMPALDQPHHPGQTMEQQAFNTRRGDSAEHARSSALQQSGPGSIIAPDVQQQAPQPVIQASMENVSLLPTDLLPPEASKDPAFRPGTGSQVAIHQPHLAIKYGVIRNGQRLSPRDLLQGGVPAVGGSRPARPKEAILNDMKTAMSAGPARARSGGEEAETSLDTPSHLPKTDEEADEQARQGPAGAAEHVSNVPAPPGLDDRSLEQARLTDADMEALRRATIEDILRNPKQKEIVEARLKPLSIDDIILYNKVSQRVPIIPGKFEPTFESMPGDVELALKPMLVRESKAIAVTEDYLLDKYAVMTTAAGLIAINNMPVPSMYDQEGNFSEELFLKKFEWVIHRPIHMLASLGIHYSWFELRVRRLFVVEEGKDG